MFPPFDPERDDRNGAISSLPAASVPVRVLIPTSSPWWTLRGLTAIRMAIEVAGTWRLGAVFASFRRIDGRWAPAQG